jgi:hypothetical protein
MDSYLMPVINAEFDSMSPAKAENLVVDLSGRILDLERAEESAFRSLKGIVGEA